MAKNEIARLSDFCSNCGEPVFSSQSVPNDDDREKQNYLRYAHQQEFYQEVEEWKKTHCCACSRPDYNLEHASNCKYYKGFSDNSDQGIESEEKLVLSNLEEIKGRDSFLTVEKESGVLVVEEYPVDDPVKNKKKIKLKTSFDKIPSLKVSNFEKKDKDINNLNVANVAQEKKLKKKGNNNKGFKLFYRGRFSL